MPDLTSARILLGHQPDRLLMSRDGRLLYAVCAGDDVICVIDTAVGRLTGTISCPNLRRYATLTHDGRLYVMVGEGVVAIVDTAARSVTGTFTLGGRPSEGVVAPDGRLAYVPLGNVPLEGPMGIAVVDTAENTVTGTFDIGFLPSLLAMSPTGDRIYAVDESGSMLVVVDPQTMSVLGKVGVGADMEGTPGLAVGPGGRQVFVPCLESGMVRLVDADSFAVTGEVKVGAGPSDVAVSPDGKRLYVARSAQSITVVDTADMSVIREFAAEGVDRLIMSPDGERLYASSVSGKSVLIFPTRFRPVATARKSEGVAMSPDGRHLFVTLGEGNAVSVISTPEKRIPVGLRPVAVVAPGDGREVYVADAAGGKVDVIDSSTDEVVGTINFESPFDLAADPSGAHVYVVGPDRLSVIDTQSRAVADHISVAPSGSNRVLATDGDRVYVTDPQTGAFTEYSTQTLLADVTFTPGQDVAEFSMNDIAPAGSGHRVFVTGGDTVVAVDLDGGPSEGFFTVEGAKEMAGSPGGPVFITRPDMNAVTVIDPESQAIVGEPIAVPGGPGPAVVSRDGRSLFVAGVVDGQVSEVDLATRTTSRRFPACSDPDSLAEAADGRLYVASPVTGTVSVVQAREVTIGVGGRPTGIVMSPHTSRAYVANSSSGTVSVIDLVTRAVVGAPFTVGGEPAGVAVGPGGGPLYVADGFNGSVAVVDAVAGTVLRTLENVGLLLRGLALSPDGALLYVADAQAQKVLVVDVGQKKVTGSVSLPHPFGLAMAEGGDKLFVTLPGERSLAVVDPRTMQESGARIRLETAAHGVCLAPGGGRLYVTDPSSDLVSVVEL
ncbi:hypothetical protein ABT330_06750 [Streptomyces sp. NPDC000658]|uniref:hypothetical protein n=1 Tax=Streptomyces sp. NPDC000658 TaxID=3154266 RepID=UPI00331BE924